jgi:hypothetical protein
MNFDNVALLFFGLMGVGGAYLAGRIVRYGGLRGAMFGARVDRTIGVLELGRRGTRQQRVRVHRLEGAHAGSPGVAIDGTSPIVLTAEQAQTLSALLLDASRT